MQNASSNSSIEKARNSRVNRRGFNVISQSSKSAVISTSTSTTIISFIVSSNDFSQNNGEGQLTQVSEMQAGTAVIAEATKSSDKSRGNNSISTQARAMSCMCFPFPRSSQVYSFWRTLETPRTMKNHRVFEVFQRMT